MKLLVFFLVSFGVMAAKQVTVSALEAVVYQDHQLKNPIGKISRGKKIWVGDVAHFNGKTLSTSYQGQLVYIEAESTDFYNTNERSAGLSYKRWEAIEDKPFESMALFHYGLGEFTFTAADYEETVTGTSQELKVRTFFEDSMVYYHGGAHYHYVSLEDVNFIFTMGGISGGLGMELFKQSFISFLAEFELQVLGSQLKIADDYQLNASGYGAGASAGVQFNLGRWILSVGGAYQYQSFNGYEFPKDTGLEVKPNWSSVVGRVGLGGRF